MSGPTPTPTPLFNHDLEFGEWVDYFVFIPTFVLGAAVCFYGYPLSHKTRGLFGFIAGFYALYFVAPREHQDYDHEWLVLLFGFLVGIVLGFVTFRLYQPGLAILGACFGLSLGYTIIVAGAYKLWCDHHLLGYVLSLALMAVVNAGLILATAKRVRRNLVIVDTAFVGSFMMVLSTDSFLGKFLGYENVRESTDHCTNPKTEVYYFVAAIVALFLLGVGVQLVGWTLRRKEMRDQYVDEDMRTNGFASVGFWRK